MQIYCRYYALAFIAEQFKVQVEVVPTIQAAVGKVKDGTCVAFAFDSVTPPSQVCQPTCHA